MNTKSIRELSNEELIIKINELKAELFNLRFQNATGQLEHTHLIKETNKTIARIKTVLTERESQSKEV